MKISRYILPILATAWIGSVSSRPFGDTLRMRDFGALPDSGEDASEALRKAVATIGKREIPTVLCFESGRYDFHAPEGQDDRVNIVARLRGIRDLIIDGGGAEFIAHGRLMLFLAEECERLTIRNFSLDWERPYITQASIVALGDGHVDLAIDRKRYPYHIEKGRIRFTDETWEREIDPESYSTAYDPQSGAVLYGTRDCPLSDRNAVFRGEAREIAPDTVRFFGTVDRPLPIGTELALYHGRYLSNAMTVVNCRNVCFEKIDLRHSPGMGVYGLRSENILLKAVCTVVNRSEKRRFSCAADAFHFTNCRGLIELDGCNCNGQGDDALNIHGIYARIVAVSKDRKQIELFGVRFPAERVFKADDEIWPIVRTTGSRGARNRIERIVRKSSKRLVVALREPLDKTFREDDFIENASWYANVSIHDCYFGRANRARGILLTTPGKVVVHNNRFMTAGTAILIEGDTDYWFESGAVCDMDIHDNLFENCGTSASNNGGSGWGEALISITPSFRPADESSPVYHRNIRIRNNRILTYDRPLLHARSVEGLQFVANCGEQTYDFPATAAQRQSFCLEGCRNVRIAENRFIGYGKPDFELIHMNPNNICHEKAK